jgi:ATP-dependent DNA helicase RecG
MHLVEQIGSGIDRMRRLMKEAKLPEPQFSTEGMFCVRFSRAKKTSEKTSEKVSEKIIKLIQGNKNITINELAQLTHRTTRTIEMQLKKLKDQKKIERIGPDKGGYWEIVDEH